MALSLPLVAVVLAVLVYRYLLYPVFFSPLSKVPAAHPIATILPVWIWWTERTGCQSRSLLAAHQRHGPVIRIGPNEVHVRSLDGLRVAFNSGKFERSDWFLQFLAFDGTPNLLTMLDAKRHAVRRRILSHIYSKSFILGSADCQMLSHILLFDRLMPIIDEAAQMGQGVDVYDLLPGVAAEFMNAYQVGTGNCLDLIRKGKEQERKVYLENGKVKVLQLKGYKKAQKTLENQMLEICWKTEEYLTSTPPNRGKASAATSTHPVVFEQLRSQIPQKEEAKTVDRTLLLIASELLDNVEAARFGIGITLTYMLHELAMRPDLQSILHKELMTLEPPLTYPPGQQMSTSTLQKLDGLPQLNAVVMETLRVHNSVLFPFRRLVPAGGAVIDGYFIPGGATIGASPYSMHMNSAAYPEPDNWNPKRWLDLQQALAVDDPRRWFWAFGSGTRMCIGNHFALLVMKVVAAAIYTNYTTHVIDDRGIEQVDNIVGSPAGEKLVLGFKRIPKVENLASV